MTNLKILHLNINNKIFPSVIFLKQRRGGGGGLMDKVSVSQPRDRGFEPHTGYDHDSSYETSTGCFQGADSNVI